METSWTHDPPCPEGGYTTVSPFVMCNERCPLCGAELTPPPEVAARRQEDGRLAAEWKPFTPEQIVALTAGRRT